MVVLSLFDGMSCGQIALNELGIVPDKYYASEIDKHAIKQTKLNFPDTVRLGSVVDVDVSQLDPINLLIGGSPCQSFSFAGKRKGMATKSEIQIVKLEQYLELKDQGFEFEGQSYLFWEYMRILTNIRKYNPDVKFLLENVEMGAKWERILSEAIGIFGVHINSNLVSAQNRARIYWTNIKVEKRGMFDELYSGIPQPKDRGILLKDILENEVDEKYYLSDKLINGFLNGKPEWSKTFIPHDNDTLKCDTLTSRYHKSGRTDPYIKMDKNGNIKPDQDKASCFTAGGHSGGNHSDMDLICVAMRGRNPENSSDRTKGTNTEQRLEPNITGKTNCLTGVAKDNLVMTKNYLQWDNSGLGHNSQGSRAWYEDGKGPCLGIGNSMKSPKVLIDKSDLISQINPSLESGGKQPYQHNRVYDTDGITPCLNTDARSPGIIVHNTMPRSSKTGKGGTGHLSRNDGKTYCLDTGQTNAIEIKTSRIRRLTPTECARLQTIPDWYKWECSDTQIYRMCGNGWTVEVIKHILSFFKI